MSYLKHFFVLIYNIVTFPLYLLTNIIPNTVDKFIYRYYKDRLQITRKNCWFLINPLSGKKIGTDVIKIIKGAYQKDRVLDLTKEDYVGKILQHQNEIKDDYIYVVIGGGDGTQGQIMKTFYEKSKNFKQLVFVPLPLGTGNDFSKSLGFLGNLGVDYLYKYFLIFNSNQLKPKQCDAWMFNIDSADRKSEEVCLCYLGLGMEAQISYLFDRTRKRFPGLFFSKKTNMAIYTISYFVNHFLSLFRSKEDMKFTFIKCKVDGKDFDTSDLQNLTIMNCYARQGIFFREWDTEPIVKDCKPQSMDDGLMEILTLRSFNHLAMTTIFLAKVGKGVQGKKFQLEFGNKTFYYHLDGEPYKIQGPARMSLKFWNKVNVLRIN